VAAQRLKAATVFNLQKIKKNRCKYWRWLCTVHQGIMAVVGFCGLAARTQARLCFFLECLTPP
jgi:hypothetical protein